MTALVKCPSLPAHRSARMRSTPSSAPVAWGVVYAAHDPRLDRQVAIKVLPPDRIRDDAAKRRFVQEAKAASALDHPNICTIHEINETDDGQLYLVMAHYQGETLEQRLERGPLALDEAVGIATQAGRGLAEAHAAGIVRKQKIRTRSTGEAGVRQTPQRAPEARQRANRTGLVRQPARTDPRASLSR